MIQSAPIRNQVAAKAVEELNANVDVEQEIANRLPEAQKALAPVLAGIVEQGAQEADEPAARAATPAGALCTHRDLDAAAAVKLLDDEGKFVRTSDGTIYLDLRPIVVEIGQQSAIASRLAERLPEDAGRVKLIDADQLDDGADDHPDPPVPRRLAGGRCARRSPPSLSGWRVRAAPDRVAGDRNASWWSACSSCSSAASRARTSSTS